MATKYKGIYPMKDKDGNVIRNKHRIVAYLKDPATGVSIRATKVFNGGIRGASSLRADMIANPAKYLKPSEEEVAEEEAAAVAEHRAKLTFAEYAAAWLDRMELKAEGGNVSKRRVTDLRKYLADACEYVGEMTLVAINKQAIEGMLDEMRRAKGERLGHPVNEQTMSKVFVAFNQVMKSAYKDEIIDENPCGRVDAPSCKGTGDDGTRALEVVEIESLLAALNRCEEAAYTAFYAKEKRLADGGHANKERHGLRNVMELSRLMAVRLALVAGLRRGELCGLRWGDISFADESVIVRHSMPTSGGLKATKACNVGVISLDADTLERLSRLQDFQLECMCMLKLAKEGEMMPPDRYVICSDLLGPTVPSNLNAWVRRWRSEADGVPRDLHLQMLRATYGTEMTGELAIADTARALRHESPRTTLAYYAKSRRANDRRPAEIMGRYTARATGTMAGTFHFSSTNDEVPMEQKRPRC